MSKITPTMIELFQCAVEARRLEWVALDALDEEVGAILEPRPETFDVIAKSVYTTHTGEWRGESPCTADDVRNYLDSCWHRSLT